jgi:hypothetical protein
MLTFLFWCASCGVLEAQLFKIRKIEIILRKNQLADEGSMGGYNLLVYGYITTCCVFAAFITGYYITVITDIMKDYEPD